MSEHITHTPTVKRLERSSDDKWIAGVCGGLGRYFDLNPAVFRLGLVVLTLLGGAGILVYLAAVLVVPAEGKQSIAADVLAGAARPSLAARRPRPRRRRDRRPALAGQHLADDRRGLDRDPDRRARGALGLPQRADAAIAS